MVESHSPLSSFLFVALLSIYAIRLEAVDGQSGPTNDDTVQLGYANISIVKFQSDGYHVLPAPRLLLLRRRLGPLFNTKVCRSKLSP